MSLMWCSCRVPLSPSSDNNHEASLAWAKRCEIRGSLRIVHGFRFAPSGLHVSRHPEVTAKRPSKDAAKAPGPSPFEARFARASG